MRVKTQHIEFNIQDSRHKIQELWNEKNNVLSAKITLSPGGIFTKPEKADRINNHQLAGFPLRGENPQGKSGDKKIRITSVNNTKGNLHPSAEGCRL